MQITWEWRGKRDNPLLSALESFPVSVFTPIIRAAQSLLLHRGSSLKSEHLNDIENKVLVPLECMTSSQRDTHGCSQIKYLQVQTVACALLPRRGTRRHFRWLSNPLKAPRYWVSFWQWPAESRSHCAKPQCWLFTFKGKSYFGFA